jgi:Mn-dependent DtxR family transcriptional regulator
MKLIEFQEKYFASREDLAKELGVSYQQLTNMIARGTTIEQLANGEWVTTHKYTKRITIYNY